MGGKNSKKNLIESLGDISHGFTEKECGAIWARFDKAGTGVLDPKASRKFLRTYCKYKRRKKKRDDKDLETLVEELMTLLDKDKDGYLKLSDLLQRGHNARRTALRPVSNKIEHSLVVEVVGAKHIPKEHAMPYVKMKLTTKDGLVKGVRETKTLHFPDATNPAWHAYRNFHTIPEPDDILEVGLYTRDPLLKHVKVARLSIPLKALDRVNKDFVMESVHQKDAHAHAQAHAQARMTIVQDSKPPIVVTASASASASATATAISSGGQSTIAVSALALGAGTTGKNSDELSQVQREKGRDTDNSKTSREEEDLNFSQYWDRDSTIRRDSSVLNSTLSSSPQTAAVTSPTFTLPPLSPTASSVNASSLNLPDFVREMSVGTVSGGGGGSGGGTGPPPCVLTLRRVVLSKPWETKKTVFFIRHGESAWNKAQESKDVKGMMHYDHPLNKVGINQARSFRESWRTYGLANAALAPTLLALDTASANANAAYALNSPTNHNLGSLPQSPLQSPAHSRIQSHVDGLLSPSSPGPGSGEGLPRSLSGLSGFSGPAGASGGEHGVLSPKFFARAPPPLSTFDASDDLVGTPLPFSGVSGNDGGTANNNDSNHRRQHSAAPAAGGHTNLSNHNRQQSALSTTNDIIKDGNPKSVLDDVEDHEGGSPGGEEASESSGMHRHIPHSPGTPDGLPVDREHDKDESERAFLTADSVIFASPLTRATQTALVALNGHPSLGKRGLKLLRSAREIKKRGGLDTVGKETGVNIFERVGKKLRKEVGEETTRHLTNIPLDPYDATAKWWTSDRDSSKDMKKRFYDFFCTLRYYDADHFIVVGHSLFFRKLCRKYAHPEFKMRKEELAKQLGKKKIQNAGCVALELHWDLQGEGGKIQEKTSIVDATMLFGCKFEEHTRAKPRKGTTAGLPSQEHDHDVEDDEEEEDDDDDDDEDENSEDDDEDEPPSGFLSGTLKRVGGSKKHVGHNKQPSSILNLRKEGKEGKDGKESKDSPAGSVRKMDSSSHRHFTPKDLDLDLASDAERPEKSPTGTVVATVAANAAASAASAAANAAANAAVAALAAQVTAQSAHKPRQVSLSRQPGASRRPQRNANIGSINAGSGGSPFTSAPSSPRQGDSSSSLQSAAMPNSNNSTNGNPANANNSTNATNNNGTGTPTNSQNAQQGRLITQSLNHHQPSRGQLAQHPNAGLKPAAAGSKGSTAQDSDSEVHSDELEISDSEEDGHTYSNTFTALSQTAQALGSKGSENLARSEPPVHSDAPQSPSLPANLIAQPSSFDGRDSGSSNCSVLGRTARGPTVTSTASSNSAAGSPRDLGEFLGERISSNDGVVVDSTSMHVSTSILLGTVVPDGSSASNPPIFSYTQDADRSQLETTVTTTTSVVEMKEMKGE